MAVEYLDVSDVTPRVSYPVGGAAQSNFAVPFVFFDEDDLSVYEDGVLVDPADYVVTGALDEDGGNVEITPAVSNVTILITRRTARELTTHIPASGPLDIPALNLQSSRTVAMIQEIETDSSRSLRQPDSDADDIADLPVTAERASKFLAFDAEGDPIAATSVTGTPVSGFMATVLDDTTAAAARTTLGIAETANLQAIFNWEHYR